MKTITSPTTLNNSAGTAGFGGGGGSSGGVYSEIVRDGWDNEEWGSLEEEPVSYFKIIYILERSQK